MRGNKTYKNSINLNHANELRIMPDSIIAMMIMIMIITMMMMMMMIITCVRPILGVSRHGCRQSRPEIIIFDDDDSDDCNDDVGEIFLSDWSRKTPFC